MDNELPSFTSRELVWNSANLWRFSGPMELRSGNDTIAEAEWIAGDQPEWRVDAGSRELSFHVVQWKPIRVEAVTIPGRQIEMGHQGSARRPRPPIEIRGTRYRLVRSGLAGTSYLTDNGDVIARMPVRATWRGGSTICIGDSPCPPWHLWILACYVGFRATASYKHMWKSSSYAGLKSLVGRRSDYDPA